MFIMQFNIYYEWDEQWFFFSYGLSHVSCRKKTAPLCFCIWVGCQTVKCWLTRNDVNWILWQVCVCHHTSTPQHSSPFKPNSIKVPQIDGTSKWLESLKKALSKIRMMWQEVCNMIETLYQSFLRIGTLIKLTQFIMYFFCRSRYYCCKYR